ncbi:MAG: zinc ribbon domain-containing protein [Candidatus Omnitrophota bacterium]|jgi:putative FmdB family regulatory protein
MPTYEYQCIDCGYRFEKFQMMSDNPIKTCPKCHRRVRRLIGIGGGIIFKGPGFYATDYRKPDTQEAKQEAQDKDTSLKDKNTKDKQPQDKPAHNKPTPQTKDKKS